MKWERDIVQNIAKGSKTDPRGLENVPAHLVIDNTSAKRQQVNQSLASYIVNPVPQTTAATRHANHRDPTSRHPSSEAKHGTPYTAFAQVHLLGVTPHHLRQLVCKLAWILTARTRHSEAHILFSCFKFGTGSWAPCCRRSV